MIDRELLNKLFRYAFSLTKKEDQAYDLLQSAIEKFLSRNCSDITNADGYLMRMIKNQFIDEQRKKQLHLSLVQNTVEEPEGLSSLSLDDLYIRDEKVGLISEALSAEERELLYLWAVEEYSIQEVADFLEVPKGTLLSRMHRLKKRLKSMLLNSDGSSRRIQS